MPGPDRTGNYFYDEIYGSDDQYAFGAGCGQAFYCVGRGPWWLRTERGAEAKLVEPRLSRERLWHELKGIDRLSRLRADGGPKRGGPSTGSGNSCVHDGRRHEHRREQSSWRARGVGVG